MTKENKLKQAQVQLDTFAANFRKPYWIPQVEQTTGSATASKYFGDPWLAKEENWPEILGVPARFILQLEVSTLPEPIATLLGKKGLVQLFYHSQEDVWPQDNDLSKLALARLVYPSQVAGSSRPAPKSIPHKKEWSPKVIQQWQAGSSLDYPRHDDADDLGLYEKMEALAVEYDIYVDDFEYVPAQGDKLGGWPFWYQQAERPLDRQGAVMLPFYQLDMGSYFDGIALPAHAPELFAAEGTGHLFVSEHDPRELVFLWAC